MALAEGDRSFEEAFPTLFRAGYRAAYRLTGSAPAAEDVASEALFRAHVRWSRINSYAHPWVVRTATNLAIDLRRRRRAGPALRADEARTSPAPERVDLVRALKRLPRRQREVVVLRYFGDLTERQISDLLGISPGAVKSHSSRGLKALRGLLADDNRDGKRPSGPFSEVQTNG